MTFVYLLVLSVVLGVVGGVGLVLVTKNEVEEVNCTHGDGSHVNVVDTTVVDEYHNNDSGTFKNVD